MGETMEALVGDLARYEAEHIYDAERDMDEIRVWVDGRRYSIGLEHDLVVRDEARVCDEVRHALANLLFRRVVAEASLEPMRILPEIGWTKPPHAQPARTHDEEE